METKLIDPNKLKSNPWNTNRVSAQNQEKLTKSISDLGFVSAVVVRELSDGTYQILGGQHRVEAAIELNITEVPIINVGKINDKKAKKIGLVDNSRYGTDDTLSLAKLYEEIGLSSEELASFLPFTEVDFDVIAKSVEIDLDTLGVLDKDEDLEEAANSRPLKTHDILRFRVRLADSEKIKLIIEKTIKEQTLDVDDELTSYGEALAYLLLNTET